MWRFRRYLPAIWGVLLAGLLASIGQAITASLTPWPLKVIFDSVLGHLPVPSFLSWLPADRPGRLGVLVLLSIGLAAMQGAFTYLAGWTVAAAGQRLVYALRLDLFAHLVTRSLAYHTRARTGDLQARLGADVQMVQQVLSNALPTLASNSLTLIGMVIGMTLMDWRFTLLTLSLLPVLYKVIRAYLRRIKQAQREARRYEGEAAAVAQEVLTSLPVVQAYQGETRESGRYARVVEASQAASRRALARQAEFAPLVNTLMATAGALMVYVAGQEVLHHGLTAGELIVLSAYVTGMYAPVRQLAKLAGSLGVAQAAAERLSEIVEAGDAVSDPPRPHRPARVHGTLTFDRVTVDYGAGRPAVDRVSLQVPAGARLALVGATGSGKSTLMRLVPRLLDPTSGRVCLDGVDLRRFALADLRSLVALLTQETHLLRGSVWENIAYPSGTRADAIAAARVSGVDEVLGRLPQGYDTEVAERGTTLSGGQRQCLAIARAMLRDASILLLDEPATGLDAQTEAVLLSALDRLTSGRTTIVVTHQLASARNADLVATLHHGVLLEVGSHAALLRSAGVYSQLVSAQAATAVGHPQLMRSSCSE